MRKEQRQTIMRCWNCASEKLKKELVTRYVGFHEDYYSVDIWLEFIWREFDLEQSEEVSYQHFTEQ